MKKESSIHLMILDFHSPRKSGPMGWASNGIVTVVLGMLTEDGNVSKQWKKQKDSG